MFAPPPKELDSTFRSKLERKAGSSKPRCIAVIISKWLIFLIQQCSHVETIIETLKNNKSPGLNGITTRHLQNDTPANFPQIEYRWPQIEYSEKEVRFTAL